MLKALRDFPREKRRRGMWTLLSVTPSYGLLLPRAYTAIAGDFHKEIGRHAAAGVGGYRARGNSRRSSTVCDATLLMPLNAAPHSINIPFPFGIFYLSN